MFWFKLRQDSCVVDSDLRIECVKSEERDKHVQEGTLEWVAPWRPIKRTVQKVLMHEVSSETITQPVETSTVQRSVPTLVLWTNERDGLEPAQ